MTVKDILKTACVLLQRNDLLDGLNGEEGDELKGEIEKLLACYKLTISELCEEYLPLEYEETLTSSSGEYSYLGFTYPPIEIMNVKGEKGKVEYKVKPLCLACDCPKITVRYRYYPLISSINDNFAYEKTPISHRVVAFGVAREYLLLSGLYDEALIYDDKFTKSLANVLFTSRGGHIKARGWF